MTTLDERALKAAKAVEGMPTEYVIRAYLVALPPAKRRYIITDKRTTHFCFDGDYWLFDSIDEAQRDCSEDERVETIEIREIRNA